MRLYPLPFVDRSERGKNDHLMMIVAIQKAIGWLFWASISSGALLSFSAAVWKVLSEIESEPLLKSVLLILIAAFVLAFSLIIAWVGGLYLIAFGEWIESFCDVEDHLDSLIELSGGHNDDSDDALPVAPQFTPPPLATDDRIHVSCPSCGATRLVPPDALGKRARCTCGVKFDLSPDV
jgi:hypothetical protein